jgi:AraC-like DNA-binding protein
MFRETSSAAKSRPANAALFPAAAPVGLGDVQATVVQLLTSASGYLERDQVAARRCLNRATSLLESLKPANDVESKDGPAYLARGGLAPWQINRLKTLVESQLASAITLEEMADLCRLSVSHFARAFKISFGEPPHSYVVRRRIARARDMMLATEEPLSQVALDCGFADQSHFSRLFRRQEGASPSAWRRAHGAKPETLKPAAPVALRRAAGPEPMQIGA